MIRMMQANIIKYACDVVNMGEKMGEYIVSARELEEKERLGKHGRRWNDIQMDAKELVWSVWIG
jgi:hypothetical protein